MAIAFQLFFRVRIAKYENYSVLLTFDDLSKNVKDTILAYNLTRFKGIEYN